MGPHQSLRVALLVFMAGFSVSAAFVSGDVMQFHGSTGRNLLQETQSCPINFEFLNYTIITSKCKGPQYPATLCCAAFKDFACPFADAINDGSNDCATTMFSYINLYGKYPPGLFASECKEGKEGLQCPASPPQSADDDSSGLVNRSPFPFMIIMTGLAIVFLFS